MTGTGLQAGLPARPGTSGAKKNTSDGGRLLDREASGSWTARPSSREPASTTGCSGDLSRQEKGNSSVASKLNKDRYSTQCLSTTLSGACLRSRFLRSHLKKAQAEMQRDFSTPANLIYLPLCPGLSSTLCII